MSAVGAKPSVAAATFSPTDISGLALWLDASQITGLVDGDPVPSWTDLAGTNHAAQATSAARPVYKTSIVNSRPVVRFDGVDDQLQTPAFAFYTGGQYTLVAVTKLNAGTETRHVLNSDNNGGTGPRIFQFRLAGPDLQFIGFSNNNNTNASDTQPATRTNWNVLSGIRRASNVQAYTNGASNGATALSGTPTGNPRSIAIGNQVIYGQAGNAYLSGDVAEVIVYNTALSDTDHASVVAYLGDKYGITI